jgi:N-formylglutamate amidohydrolase
MKRKLPILIIIPHGGYSVPEEMSGLEDLDRFQLFLYADTCANSLFAFEDKVSAKLDTNISRLFIDLDREKTEVPPASGDGVIKKTAHDGTALFRNGSFPDHIAISNLIRRYYLPFHDTIQKIIDTGEVRLIIECHTMLAVSPETSRRPGRPRPIISLENSVESRGKDILTCEKGLAADFADILKKNFSDEKETVTESVQVNNPRTGGHILNTYGRGDIPMLRLSLSKSLFINDRFFSYDFMKVDEIRIQKLKTMLWQSIEKFYRKNF